MNLQQLQQGLGDLYPQLRTRSGKKITTHEAKGAVTPDGLAVTVKTLFPPTSLGRSELAVSVSRGGLDIRPLDPAGMADTERFAELLRDRWMREQPDERLGPLRLVKDDDGRYCFHVGPEEAGLEAAGPEAPSMFGTEGDLPASTDIGTDPATPKAKQAQIKRERGNS